ncbi:AraC family transcriptional regulator [Actinocrispum wychmicini]|uniref:helix-turn-helix transcriptional regulator n=1 Tax=Actinocrispum wychmicini TaxID=1213861 RepID=UPI00312CA6E1
MVAGTPGLRPRRGEPPIHRLEVPLPHSLPFTVGTFDSIGPMSRAEFPHRHTFHEIVYVSTGSGVHVVDVARWELAPPQVFVVAPGQVHRWDDVQGLEGFVILFTDDFLLHHPVDRHLLRRLSGRPLAPCDGGLLRPITELYDEYRWRADGVESVLRALLHVLVVRMARVADTGAPGPAETLVDQFARLTGQPGGESWSVRECAARMGVTPGYLAEAIKAATGRTPSHLIREARVREAKRLLVSSDLTVRQVADRTGFADPAYFCRFFRRETGLSPGDFRRVGDRAGNGNTP